MVGTRTGTLVQKRRMIPLVSSRRAGSPSSLAKEEDGPIKEDGPFGKEQEHSSRMFSLVLTMRTILSKRSMTRPLVQSIRAGFSSSMVLRRRRRSSSHLFWARGDLICCGSMDAKKHLRLRTYSKKLNNYCT